MSFSVDGVPPSQVLKLSANQPVTVSRLEYMLSNETCIAGEELSLQGETLEVPLKSELIRKIWNTPRPDRNPYDHSGPAKVALAVRVGGKTHQYILPVQMDAFVQNNTHCTRVTGYKNFYGG